MRTWAIQDVPDLSGKLAIVTGGSSGIGFETAKALANSGAQVIIAARDLPKGRQAVEKIKHDHTTARVETEELDLASLASIEKFAEQMLDRGRPIDILINNAGVMLGPQRRTSADGFELHFGTNHLGHFALTGRLLPLLVESSAPRVVTVSAVIARWGEIDFTNLQSENRYGPVKAYLASKLANLLFALELDRRAGSAGLTSVAAHPGTSLTGWQRHTLPTPIGRYVRPLYNSLLGQPPDKSALPSLYAATAPDIAGGSFLGPTGRFELRGLPGIVPLPTRALAESVAHELWEVSEQLTHVHFQLPSTQTLSIPQSRDLAPVIH